MNDLLVIPREVFGFEDVKAISRRYDLNPGLRPCMASIMSRGFDKIGCPNGSQAAFLIAVELHRLGVSEDYALLILEDWNKQNLPPMQTSALTSKVRSAFKKAYRFGCFSQASSFGFILGDSIFCIGADSCSYYKQNPIGAKKYSGPWLLIDSGWIGRLKKSTILVYNAIQYVEKQRQFKPGSTLFCSYRELYEYSNVTMKYIRPALEELEAAGLIEFKPGDPRGRGRKATEIRRTLPIPAA